MSNITKAFDQKRKCGLRMALGGVVDPEEKTISGPEANTTLGKAYNERNTQWAADEKARQQLQAGLGINANRNAQVGYSYSNDTNSAPPSIVDVG